MTECITKTYRQIAMHYGFFDRLLRPHKTVYKKNKLCVRIDILVQAFDNTNGVKQGRIPTPKLNINESLKHKTTYQ